MGKDLVECNSYGLTMWEVKTKYTVGTLGLIGSGGWCHANRSCMTFFFMTTSRTLEVQAYSEQKIVIQRLTPQQKAVYVKDVLALPILMHLHGTVTVLTVHEHITRKKTDRRIEVSKICCERVLFLSFSKTVSKRSSLCGTNFPKRKRRSSDVHVIGVFLLPK